jgi:dUTPase
MFKVLDECCTPKRGTKYSAYVDLFSREDVVIGAGETKVVKLGVKLEQSALVKSCVKDYHDIDLFLKSHYLEVALRSSLAVKGLIIANGIGIIDLDYVSHCKIGKALNNGYCEHFKQK